MKKLIYVIPITILICLLLSDKEAYAAYTGRLVYFEFNSSNNLWYAYPCSFNSPYTYDNNLGYIICPTGGYWQAEASIAEAYNVCIQRDNWEGRGARTPSINNYIIVVQGVINNLPQSAKVFGSLQELEDYINPPPTPTPTPTPTPIPSMWDKFYEWYYKIYGYYPADDSLFGYFKSLFDEDQESSGSGGPSKHSISTHRPPPTPTPTPIPYSVIIQPVYDSSGNVVNYTYNYSYTSESGETIIVTSPPDNNSNCNCNDDTETYNPDPLAVPSSALDAWYMFAYDENEHPNPELQNPNDDFGTGMKYIEDNIDEYDKPIDYIMAVVNSFPDEWLLLFGMGIGLIFIAGIISRFLS